MNSLKKRSKAQTAAASTSRIASISENNMSASASASFSTNVDTNIGKVSPSAPLKESNKVDERLERLI